MPGPALGAGCQKPELDHGTNLRIRSYLAAAAEERNLSPPGRIGREAEEECANNLALQERLWLSGRHGFRRCEIAEALYLRANRRTEFFGLLIRCDRYLCMCDMPRLDVTITCPLSHALKVKGHGPIGQIGVELPWQG